MRMDHSYRGRPAQYCFRINSKKQKQEPQPPEGLVFIHIFTLGSSAPTGLCPTAQGCRAAATLGGETPDIQQPQRGCGARHDNATTPLGLLKSACSIPRVGAKRQPWAEGQIPFGETLIRKDVYKDKT